MEQQKKPTSQLGAFWIETVRRAKSPTLQRMPLGLSAAERLEQLQEAVETDQNGTPTHSNYPYRKASLDGVAARRDNYLRETFRSQSPLNMGYSGRSPTPVSIPSRYI